MRGRDVIDINDFKRDGIPWKRVVAALIVVVVVILVRTGYYTVDPEEVGVVQRLGRYTKTTGPGLHFRLPFHIETVTKVPVERQLTESFGFRSGMDRSGRSSKVSVKDESLMLTGDLNVAVVEWTVQYRIDDPYKYLFKVRSPADTFRDMTEAVVREVVGDRTVNEVLTIGRQEIADQVKTGLQELADKYDTGLRVEQIVLQDINPPDAVKASFNEVNQSQQEREKLINQAKSDYNQAIPKAKGEALQVIEEAEGYALDRVNRAKGEAERFEALHAAYKKAPDITRRRIYLETMGHVLPRIKKKTIIDDRMKNVLPLLPLAGGVPK